MSQIVLHPEREKLTPLSTSRETERVGEGEGERKSEREWERGIFHTARVLLPLNSKNVPFHVLLPFREGQ